MRIRGGRGRDRGLGDLQIGERHLVETLDDRAEAFEIFFLPAGGERGQRAAVEGALEGDDPIAFRCAVRRVVFARHLDGAFHRFGAGIAEEDDVGEARVAQPLRNAFGLGHLIEIGDVPELLRLRGQRGDHARMRVPQRIDGDPGGEVEIALAVGRDEPNALAPLESKVRARIGR